MVALIRRLFFLDCTTLDGCPHQRKYARNERRGNKIEGGNFLFGATTAVGLSSPRRSHAAGTGLDEPEVPHAVMQETEQKVAFSVQASVGGFLYVDCTRTLEQEGTILSQADIGV